MQFEVRTNHLEAAASMAGLEDDVLHLDYSGRAMYGAKCPAVYVDNYGEAAAFLVALALAIDVDDLDPLDVVKLARSTRTDGMGRGIVAYWPDLYVLEPEAADA